MKVVQCLRSGPGGYLCTRPRSHPGPHVAGVNGSYHPDQVLGVWVELEAGSAEWVDTIEAAREERDALSTHL